jgi:hypothetical protein
MGLPSEFEIEIGDWLTLFKNKKRSLLFGNPFNDDY